MTRRFSGDPEAASLRMHEPTADFSEHVPAFHGRENCLRQTVSSEITDKKLTWRLADNGGYVLGVLRVASGTGTSADSVGSAVV